MLTINCLKFLTNLMMQFMNMIRGVHGLGWIGFGVDPHPTQLNWVNGKWTRS